MGLKRFLKSIQKPGRNLKQNISQQGFYASDAPSPKIFKPGEFILEEDIKKYKIPSHLFIHPDSLRNTGAFDFAAKKKNIFSVGIIRTVKGLGDILILSVIGKALKEQYPGKVKVWFAVYPGHEALLENNPHIDKVFTSEKELMEARPDVHFNVNDLEFKTELRKDEKIVHNRTALYLNKMELSVENKTPVYVVTEEEKLTAQKTLKKLGYDLNKSIIGIQLYGSNISKTYPHMLKVAKELEKRGYQIFYLDSDLYKYELREIAAIANEMALMITPNSFFYHLAGALKKRAVALFGYTDGKIWTEDYEKVTYVQIPCPKGNERCWWRIECIPGKDLQEKETTNTPECLSKIPVETVLKEVDRHLLSPKKILIFVLTYNCLKLTKQMINSIKTFHNYDLFVIDNASTDGTPKWLKEQGIDHVVKKTTVCQACNIGLKMAQEKSEYDYAMLCSNDIMLADNYLDTIVEVAERRKSYLTVGKTVNIRTPDRINFNKFTKKVEIPIVDLPGGGFSATLISRECLEKVGGFDERFYPRYQEDEDYLLRVRLAGNELIQTWATNFLHLSGAVVYSNSEEKAKSEASWNRNVRVFVDKWGFDPYAQRRNAENLDKIKRERPRWKQKVLIPLSNNSVKVNKGKEFYPVDLIRQKIKKHGKATVLVIRRMGGFGDILFSTVFARTFKKYFGEQVHITYAIPVQFKQLLDGNPFIDHIITFPGAIKSDFDSIIDITEYEYRTEVEEILKHGEVRTHRTQLYLNLAGLEGRYKPDYLIRKEEKAWAEDQWSRVSGIGQRIVLVDQGSNLMRTWPHMPELGKILKREGFRVFEFNRRSKKGGSHGDYPYSFRQSAAIVSCADLVVSAITGMANLAATLDIPAITIFSNENGKIFAKMFKSMIPVQGVCPHFPDKNYCGFAIPCLSGTMKTYRKYENVRIPLCLQNLSASMILNQVREVLK